MKKFRLFLLTFIVIFCTLGCNKAYATDDEDETQKLLYQDATINTDGSVTVKEALWLNGTYNGSNRKIKFKNNSAYTFTGIYSNFSGDSDIYDATEITNIKVFDISQANFNSFEDINNTEKEFKKVNSASKGNYGVYTVTEKSSYSNVSIYCPSKKRKVFYIEYTIKNAVVLHNDIAELYWCFLENTSSDTILDYKLKVHLPGEDNNVMVWSHGPSTGKRNIIDNKTLSLEDSNIKPYKYETIRIIFNKNLVPQAEKVSNVNAKDYILKYEKAMANPETASEESEKIEIENKLSTVFLELEKNPYIFYYNDAKNLLEKLTWNDELRNSYEIKLNNLKDLVNQDWKETVEWRLKNIYEYNSLSQSNINRLIETIDEGFDEDAKKDYYSKANELQELLNEKKLKQKQNILRIVIICYVVLGIICILKLLSLFLERNCCHKKYYRDFPSNDKAYIIDYLMNKKVTSKTLSVTILDLISNRKILLEKNPNDEQDFIFVLPEEDFQKTTVENEAIEILFNVVGSNNRCSAKDLKTYSTNKSNSSILINHFTTFTNNVENEIKYKSYFKKKDLYNKYLKLAILVIVAISSILGLIISTSGYINIFNYYLAIISLSIVYFIIISLDKGRTKTGKLEYSKWLAHKRFLKDFSNFDKKELPEIILWERYFVSAVTLGCSSKVLKKLEINLVDYEAIDEFKSIAYEYMQYQSIKNLNCTLNNLIRNAKSHSEVYSPSSSNNSYSSGSDGFGGSSSSGGSGGGGGGWSRF